MRLFIAIDLDEEAKAAVAAEQRRIAEEFGNGSRRLRFVRPEQVHLTLAFLGEVEPPLAEDLAIRMAQPLDQPEFRVVFGGLGTFPPRGRPRTLFLGVVSGAAETMAVYERLVLRVRAAAVPLEARPFVPHLTLARWRESTGPDAKTAMRLTSEPSRRVAEVQVRSAVLYQSRLSPAGPSYTALARAELRPV